MKTSLYRHFNQAGVLLYVGVSLSSFARLVHHRTSAAWVNEISTMTIEHFDSRPQALRAERSAIRAEKPLWNKVHSLKACIAARPNGDSVDWTGYHEHNPHLAFALLGVQSTSALAVFYFLASKACIHAHSIMISIAKVAKDMGLCTRTVSASVSALRAGGFVQVIKQGHTNVYFLHPELATLPYRIH